METISKTNDAHDTWVRLADKEFRPLIPYEKVMEAIERVAQQINRDYQDKELPLFLGVLNGSFMFMAELVQRIHWVCETSFVKIASYRGTSSSGRVQELIGLTNSLQGRDVIIVEDIVLAYASIRDLLPS